MSSSASSSAASGGAPAPQRGLPRQRPGFGLSGSTPLALVGKIVGLGMVAAITLWLAMPLAATKEYLLLALLLIGAAGIVFVYVQPWKIPPKYLVPGVVFLILFQLVPVAYTVGTAFTNFGDGHRGTKTEAINDIKVQNLQPVAGSQPYKVTVAERGSELVLLLVDAATQQVQVGDAKGLTPAGNAQVGPDGRVTAADGVTVLSQEQFYARQADIVKVAVPTEKGALKVSGLTTAQEYQATRAYDAGCDCIVDAGTGERWTADNGRGNFINDKGQALSQGWKVNVGLANWLRPFQDQNLASAFLGMLVWNFAFALITVFGTFAVGLLMALALNSERLKALKLYRVLIVLPYAMPAFAMLLVWRDMFNPDFGLINNLTGLHINWFGGALSAKVAVLLVQFWLGYPYMFLVTTGALQAIPSDLVEAASVDGASRLFSFRTVTLPLLLVATAPLLISSFAFNFNNYNAIGLTTEGGPFPPDSPTIGGTDLLITYTYRLAFGAGGVQYGLAAAMSILIFLIVAVISIISFRRTAALEEIN